MKSDIKPFFFVLRGSGSMFLQPAATNNMHGAKMVQSRQTSTIPSNPTTLHWSTL